MGVRLCYLERSRRGGMIRAVRLFGQGSAERWPGMGVSAPKLDTPDAAMPWIERGAEWVGDRLQQSRSAGTLEAVVLDVDGSTCTWIAGAGRDVSAVAAAARLGPSSGDDALVDMPGADSGAVTPVSFFAGDALDSTIQPLASPFEHEAPTPDVEPRRGLLRRAKPSPVAAPEGRIGVLAACDLPGRLFVDALDRQGVVVEHAMTLWHAMAQAWDPGSPAAQAAAGAAAARSVASSDTSTAIVLLDAGDADDESPSRLVWCWSKGGALVAGGSLRLPAMRRDEALELSIGQNEASRLAAEWLAWSLQLGVTPRRVLCIVPESVRDSGDAGRFGAALASALPGASVDAIVHDDPVGTTFARLAAGLESTPPDPAEALSPGSSLLELSTRPVAAHRRMHVWLACLVLVASAVMGVVAWQVHSSTARIEQGAALWQAKGIDSIKQVFPAAIGVKNMTPLLALKQEVSRRERELLPPSQVDHAKPVMEELELLSLIIGSEDFSLELVDFDSGTIARFVVTAREFNLLERLADSLRRISGSGVDAWQPVYNETNVAGAKVFKATFSGNWNESPAKPGGG